MEVPQSEQNVRTTPPSFRKRPWTSLANAKLIGTVSHPNRYKTPDSSAAIGIVVVTDPEWIATHLRDDGSAVASTAFFSVVHTYLPPPPSATRIPRTGASSSEWHAAHNRKLKHCVESKVCMEG